MWRRILVISLLIGSHMLLFRAVPPEDPIAPAAQPANVGSIAPSPPPGWPEATASLAELRVDGVTCDADLEQVGRGAVLMVAAQRYAPCLYAHYQWFPETRRFRLANDLASATFTLGSPLVAVTRMGRTYWFNLSELGVWPYERAADTANMAPLRFLNDVFDVQTHVSDLAPGEVHVVFEGHALPPVWDAPLLDRCLDENGELRQPAGGWPMLPSTLWHYQRTKATP